MRDGLNTGLDSDRFQVDWHLDSCQVEKCLNSPDDHGLHLDDLLEMDVEILNSTKEMEPPSGMPKLNHVLLSIEIRSDYLALKTVNFPLAKAWRQASREILEYAFANRYTVIDFLYEHGRSYYVLEYQESH